MNTARGKGISPWIAPLAILAWIACADGPRGEPAVDVVELDTLLDVGSTSLYVHAEGRRGGLSESGIVLHGGPLLDHGYLKRAFGPLHERLTLVYFDQRLSGRSAGVVDSTSVRIDTLVHDIERVRASLDLGMVHVIGHSWGGLLALKYALGYPAQVRSLVLISPMPPSADLWRQEQELSAKLLAPRDTAGMGAIRSSDALAEGDPDAVERLLLLSFRQAFADPNRAQELNFHVEPDYLERRLQFAYLSGDLAAYDLTEGLSQLHVPTLIIFGAEEAGAEIGQKGFSELPCAWFELIPGSGHFSFIEKPQVFARTLSHFLEDIEQESVRCSGGKVKIGPRRQ